LGNLMKQSHQSLKDLYECSHEDLDAIVKLAEKHTLGARLTGAAYVNKHIDGYAITRSHL